jgi:hypothetical protein
MLSLPSFSLETNSGARRRERDVENCKNEQDFKA